MIEQSPKGVSLYIFDERSINILQITCRRVPIHKTCSKKKLAKCERRVIEFLINNSLTGKELFYRLNEQFVSNRAGNIIFCDGTSYRRAADNWPDLYWRRIICPDGPSLKKDHPSSINSGRTMRRTIGVSCDSSRVFYLTSFLDGFPRKEDEKCSFGG